MDKQKKNQGAQNTTLMIDVSNKPPSYETASKKINTDKDKNIKRKSKSNYCRCKDHTKHNKRPKTWASITRLYGDADTTEVWNGEKVKPNTLFESKKRDLNRQEVENNKILFTPIVNKRSNQKYKKRNKFNRNSIISFYHRPKKNKHNKISKNLIVKQLIKEKDEKIRSPITNIRFQKGRTINSPVDFLGTGDICVRGPCRDGIECLNKTYKYQDDNKLVKLRNKTKLCKCNINSLNTEDNLIHKLNTNNVTRNPKPGKIKKQQIITQKNINVGHGDQPQQIITPSKLKYNIIKKIFRHTCKCRIGSENALQTVDDAADQTGEPFFEIKVDSQNMHVLNSNEIKNKVKSYGRLQRKRSCVCPTRFKRNLCLKSIKKHTCKEGICEKAQKNQQTNVNCKCIKKNNVIDCNDLTCDIKRKVNLHHKAQLYQSPTHKGQNKPLFEVIVDPDNMNIINTNEIEDILKKTPKNEICPTGICNNAEKNNMQINCKCINKKLIPVIECTQETCNKPKTKCKLSYLCSRVFSKSEQWNTKHINVNRKRKKRMAYRNETDKKNIKAKSDIYRRNGLLFKISKCQDKRVTRDETLPDRCFCECDKNMRTKRDVNNKTIKRKKDDERLKKEKKERAKNTKNNKSQPNQHKQINMTLGQRILYCLKRKHVRCERRLKEEEKQFKSYERKTIAENKKIKKIQEKNKRIEEQHWNCITKFLSGVLNLTFQTIKNVIITVFSIITNPIGSYVYARERTKNPNATFKRFSEWLTRTWGNRSSQLSKPLKDSHMLNVIADQIEDSSVFETLFADRGRTQQEKAMYERKIRLRKQRMRKRHDQALYGCRHMLLTTLRKTPCMWFYLICPDMYPQCLSLLSFMNNFLHILLYLAAFICWTPCIACFELCRAFLCCFFCTN